jgi:hypothetical protein
MDALADRVTKSLVGTSQRQGEFNVALAKSLRGIGQLAMQQEALIKSQQEQIAQLGQRLGVVERTPMPRKSVSGTAQPIRKSFDGNSPAEGLSRDRILDGLNRLMMKSRDNGFRAPCGEPIDTAVSRYEQFGEITHSMLNDVAAELGVVLPPRQ